MATERPRPRAVLDTNIIVAAHLSRNTRSPTKEILQRWQRREFNLLYSDDLRAEVAEKLVEKGVAPDVVELFLTAQAASGTRIEVPPAAVTPVIPADPDDDLVIACAVVGQATHLVTYDPHFAVLGGKHQGVQIVDALAFLTVLRAYPSLPAA